MIECKHILLWDFCWASCTQRCKVIIIFETLLSQILPVCLWTQLLFKSMFLPIMFGCLFFPYMSGTLPMLFILFFPDFVFCVCFSWMIFITEYKIRWWWHGDKVHSGNPDMMSRFDFILLVSLCSLKQCCIYSSEVAFSSFCLVLMSEPRYDACLFSMLRFSLHVWRQRGWWWWQWQ